MDDFTICDDSEVHNFDDAQSCTSDATIDDGIKISESIAGRKYAVGPSGKLSWFVGPPAT